jgi:DNA-binding NarL/FixJ family response regulator
MDESANGRAEVSVLLVEDDAMVRGWIEAVLKDTEFRIVGIASSAGQGVELAASREPELVLTDYRLPDPPGTELVRELRLRGGRAPVVVMTANQEPGLVTPGTPDSLNHAVRRS